MSIEAKEREVASKVTFFEALSHRPDQLLDRKNYSVEVNSGNFYVYQSATSTDSVN